MSQKVRDHILSWYQEGLAAVDPESVTREALAEIQPGTGKLVVLSVGKAAVAMARAADSVLGERIDSGLIVAKQGQITEELPGFIAIEAGHPVPDLASLRAGEIALSMVQNLTANDTVIALISGGGSALMEHPVVGISLMDMQVTTELLMYAGAGIHELNTTRKALSAIKGGGLRREMRDARCRTLLLSDVIGNDPSVIASGPTIAAPTNRKQAWQVIADFNLQDQVPENVRQLLSSESPPADHFDASGDTHLVIADNDRMVKAVVPAIEREGLSCEQIIHGWRGDARELAHKFVAAIDEASADVLIGGGEATSLVRGSGLGGRNTEMALVAAMELSDVDGWSIASLASDGDDGNSGAAGGIVNANTVSDRAIAEAALAISDSAGYLEQHEALVVTGHSGTNVNDIYLAVRNEAITGEKP